MARKKSKNSKYPFAGLGLDKEEEVKLKALLKLKEMSVKGLSRYLIKKWMVENEGLLKLKG